MPQEPLHILLEDSHEDFDPELVNLAREVLEQCRVNLMLSYRFLNAALWRMPFEPAHLMTPVDSDGLVFWFDPLLTLSRFKRDANELVRDMLHVIVHCILRHPFDLAHNNTRAWWLACDIATEAMALDMASLAFPSALDAKRRAALAEFRKTSKIITPQTAYSVLDEALRADQMGRDVPSNSSVNVNELEYLFLRDSHAYWPRINEEPNTDQDGNPDEDSRSSDNSSASHTEQEGSQAAEESSTDDQADTPTDEELARALEEALGKEPSEDQDEEGEAQPSDDLMQQITQMNSESLEESELEAAELGIGLRQDMLDDEPPYNDGDSPFLEDAKEEAEAEWRNVSKLIQEEIEAFVRSQSFELGSLLRNLSVSNRKSIDYADFLRRFASMREDMKVNDDEFDYIFYTYGMGLYGNMPLVEPLEYQETKRVRDFVVAIDTSGSCSGELVQHFIDRTFQILRESGEFAGKVNVHLIQCDVSVREDVKITSVEELERYQQNFTVKGMGGTDFRPVFAYVDELIQRNEFDDLVGLIYFTDGYGMFPEHAPQYQTAFVFVDDKGNTCAVPPWAMKVILDNEQLRTL